ncbi:glycosyl hydrolase family 18 protein [Isoptericola sp. 4D.3]|uniref:chitinase n=1 Tax=Isoptericola peretonis TaxID=2918523 RepID=A0ABT0J784_9MICO|nr:glycosyl hydrolase family 18 protein [Isoptericola sp. 4D.3]
MRHRTSPRRHGALPFVAAAAVVALTAAGASAAPSSASSSGPSGVPAAASAHDADGVNGFTTLGYFPAWATETHGYEVADLAHTGAAADLTHLTYAFGNVTSDLVCDITDAEGPEGPEGDPQNDYLRLFGAAASVDGVADSPDQALAGNFNQLRKLKEAYPGLKVMISLGGWTWSDNFAEATLTPESRQRLVDSCIDTYLDGNLPVVGAQGGAGAAAGIFDGFDVDWEWPAADGEHPAPHPDVEKENFLALMELFRAELDERTAATGDDYLLTGFAPAGWAPRTQGGWDDPRLAAVVDFLNVQGYDYTGPWAATQTGHQGNLHPYTNPDGSSANWGLAADGLLGAYRAAGYDGDQLVLGMAAYGYGWEGVDDPTPGAAAAGSLGQKLYSQLRTVGTEHYDETAMAGYRYDGDQWWSLDTPRSVTAKAEWVAENGYGGAYFWDIAGDHDNELGSALAGTLRAATPGPRITGEGADPWYATGVYTKGDVVAHDGVEYRAAWWTRDDQPGSGAVKKNPWQKIGPRGTAPAPAAAECAPAWDADAVYRKGDVVSRAGVNHTALWYAKGDRPGTDVTGPWDAGAPCA